MKGVEKSASLAIEFALAPEIRVEGEPEGYKPYRLFRGWSQWGQVEQAVTCRFKL